MLRLKTLPVLISLPLGTERSWLEQGGVVGENVVPLARNFGSAELDIEAEAILGPVITGPHAISQFARWVKYRRIFILRILHGFTVYAK